MLASAWVSNLGDGIAIAAGPLLVASQTDQAFLVALAALLQWLPPFVFGLFAGAIADRLDRRLIVITVDLLRAVVLALLAASVLTDTVSIWLVLRRDVPARHRRGVRRQHAEHVPADARAPRRPRDRQRPAAGRLHHDQPARRAADRGRALRDRDGLAVRGPGGARRPGGAPARQGRAATARPGTPTPSRPGSGTTSSRGSAGPGTTPRSAP